MSKLRQSKGSRWWLLALLPITAFALFLFFLILARFTGADFSHDYGSKMEALCLAGAAAAYGPNDSKGRLPQKLVGQFRQAFGMFLYLWILFALFSYHKAVVLSQYTVPYKPFGVAFINAFILVKVMLVGDKLNVFKLRGRPLAYPILQKSITLAIIFVLFSFAEAVVTGLWKGKQLAECVPKFGGGSAVEIIVVGLILTVALIPFFAFRELSRALGGSGLGGLLWKTSTGDDKESPSGSSAPVGSK
jgi:hypothetical protein